MRKLLMAAVLLIFPVSTLLAQDLDANQRWVEQVDGSLSAPFSTNALANYSLGFGGDVAVGYRLSPLFSLSLDSGYYQYDLKNQASTYFSYVPLLVVARFNLMSGPIHPYLFLGAGLAINTNSAYSLTNSEADFLLAPGAGVMFVVGSKAAIYVQGRVDMDFVSGNLGGTLDRPAIFIPIQAGLVFYVL